MSAKHLTNGHAPEGANSLNACETIIEKGLQTFIEVGDALTRIKRDEKAFETKCIELGISTERALDILELLKNFK